MDLRVVKYARMGLQCNEAKTGAVTLIQRFGSTAHKIAGSEFE